MDNNIRLEEKVTHLEKHVTEQNTEIFRLGRRVDELLKALKKQESRIEALEDSSGEGAVAPADEKPPHY